MVRQTRSRRHLPHSVFQSSNSSLAAAEKVRHAHLHQLERLRYEAALAERQFRRVDPDNRLVAAELERRWEEALRTFRRTEQDWRERSAPSAEGFSLDLKLKNALISGTNTKEGCEFLRIASYSEFSTPL